MLSKVYFHKVKLGVLSSITPMTVGFCDTLSFGAILGRQDFFNGHRITFDPTTNPPGMEIERFYRS